ncbi:hypothetical protein EAF00_006633 [Botryotinia globosa]|nr:hypothetical protein EAF00_006633 [Botryotinia globosa]
MQFSTITFPLLTLFLTNTLAMPSSPNTNILDSRSNSCYEDTACSCGIINTICNGGNVVGQTRCRCPGQDGRCDVVMCKDYALNQVMVCGQSGTGCVYI